MKKVWLSASMAFLLILWSGSSVKAQLFEEKMAFGAGEKVFYKAFYNWHFIWVNAGAVSFSVNNQKYNNKPVFKLSSIGTTYSNYDFFYKVRDTFITYVDTLTLAPVYYYRRSNEGSGKVYEDYRFEQEKKLIYCSISKDDDPVKKSVINWQEGTVDLLTMVYCARNIDFSKYQVDEKIPIRMVVDGAIHDLYIRYLGIETIDTRDKQRFRCLKFSPLLMEGTIFEAGEDMTVWVSDDDNRIPIMVEAEILVGSVNAIFERAEGLKYPMTARLTYSK